MRTSSQAAREQLVSYSARLADDGLAVGSAGNLSVRLGDLVAITPSGVGYDETAARRHLPGHAGRRLSWTSRPRNAVHARRPCTWRSTRRPARARSCTRTRPRSSRCPRRARSCRRSTTRSPRLGGPVRVAPLRAVRVGRGWPRPPSGAGRPQRGHPAQPRGDHLRRRPGRRPTTARCCWSGWPVSTGWRWSYGEPAILSAAELDEVSAEARRRRYGERRPGQRPLTTATAQDTGRPLGHGDRARRAHPGCARPAGRGHPARPGQRPAAPRSGPPRRARPPARRVDLAKLGASVLAIGAVGDDLLGDILDRRDGQARRRHQRAEPQERSPDVGHDPADPAERRAPRAARPGRDAAARARPTSTWTACAAAGRCWSARRTRSAASSATGLAAGGRGGQGGGALVAVDVLHPGSPRDLERLAAAARAGRLVPARTATSCSPSPAAATLTAAAIERRAGARHRRRRRHAAARTAACRLARRRRAA